MNSALDDLTDKEKETLRLIVRGHDAKSAANALDLSVHTINERLRNARRKLDVTSSREAARLLFERENSDPKNLGYRALGDDAATLPVDDFSTPQTGRPATLWIGGITMTLVAAMALAFAMVNSASTADGISSETVASDAEKESAAREWLALVDAGDWEGAHAATSSNFQEVLNFATFRSASTSVRDPLGAVLEREAVSVDLINQNGTDYSVVVFRTQFENGSTLTEQISLEAEDGEMRVAGYFFI